MQLISILATSNNGIIGINDSKKSQYTIPWRIPSDMKHFKSMTKDNILIMGSRTYRSLPPIFFTNDSRKIIVLTHNKHITSDKKNVFIGYSKDHVVKIAKNLADHNHKEIIICGGGEIYALFMFDIKKWIVSHVNTSIHDHDHNDEIINISNILDYLKNNSQKIVHIRNNIQNENDQYPFSITEYLF